MIARSLVAAVLLGLLGVGTFGVSQPAPVRAATSGAGQKVVIIVGPASYNTNDYLSQARDFAQQAQDEGMSVTEIFTPHATWDAVKHNAQDANLLVYFGHGNGFPTRHGPDLREDSQDGFGLNSVDGGSLTSDVKYWGGDYVRQAIHLAPHAVVLLYRLCYASGNGESGLDAPELPSSPSDVKVAIQRVDNFAAGFLAVGAGAVFAWGWPQKINLPYQLAETDKTMDRIFEEQADTTGLPTSFIGKYDYRVASHRTPGAMLHLDPHATLGHLRALSGNLDMTASQWRGDGPGTDTTPPVLSDVSAGVSSATLPDANGNPTFSPNGDGIDDTLSVNYNLSEPGTLETTVIDADGRSVLDVSASSDGGPGTTTWDGTNGTDVVPDGRYTLVLIPTDLAGNVGAQQTITASVLTALSAPGSSVAAFDPGGVDPLADSVRFNATLTQQAAVEWRVVDGAGKVVRNGSDDLSAAPGDIVWHWDGLDDQGNIVPDGTYQGVVSATTDAGTISYGSPVFVGPFQARLSDDTLRRGQRVKINVFNTEVLSAPLTLTIKQKGVAPYTLTLNRITDHRYSLMVTLAGGGAKGRSTWTVQGLDEQGNALMFQFQKHLR